MHLAFQLPTYTYILTRHSPFYIPSTYVNLLQVPKQVYDTCSKHHIENTEKQNEKHLTTMEQ